MYNILLQYLHGRHKSIKVWNDIHINMLYHNSNFQYYILYGNNALTDNYKTNYLNIYIKAFTDHCIALKQ